MVGGCAANVAIALAKQDIRVEVTGCVGDDPSANLIESFFEQTQVGVGKIHRVAGYPTSKTVVLLIEGEDRRYLHTFGANAAFSVEHFESQRRCDGRRFPLGAETLSGDRGR